MNILLNADEHLQWEAAVATWPTCQTCGGKPCAECNGTGIVNERHEPWATERLGCTWCYGQPCPHCVAGRVPQPVYVVIEGERHGWEWQAPRFVVPARWRVPDTSSMKFAPREIRARCPKHMGHLAFTEHGASGVFDRCPNCHESSGEVILASAATVEVLPVVDQDHDDGIGDHACHRDDYRISIVKDGQFVSLAMALHPLPVPGRHFVAVVEVQS